MLAILRDQEEECDRLAGVLYTKGLTQEQVGDFYDRIYGQHFSKASISRMVECVRTQVNDWLERGLEEYYPVVFVDCVHIKIHRKRSVASEAFYVALAVTEEGTHEVLGICHPRSAGLSRLASDTLSETLSKLTIIMNIEANAIETIIPDTNDTYVVMTQIQEKMTANAMTTFVPS